MEIVIPRPGQAMTDISIGCVPFNQRGHTPLNPLKNVLQSIDAHTGVPTLC
jgi:hypothetical protein